MGRCSPVAVRLRGFAATASTLAEYVARHAPDEVTEAMDRVCAEVGDQVDAFISAAGRQVWENTEW